MNEPAVIHTQRAFSLTCAVEANIRTPATVIWRIVTDADGFPRWNSTVSRIEGQIRAGRGASRALSGNVQNWNTAQQIGE